MSLAEGERSWSVTSGTQFTYFNFELYGVVLAALTRPARGSTLRTQTLEFRLWLASSRVSDRLMIRPRITRSLPKGRFVQEIKGFLRAYEALQDRLKLVQRYTGISLSVENFM